MALPVIHHTYRVVSNPEAKNVGQNGTPLLEIRAASNKNKKVDPGTGDNGSDYKTVATQWANLQAWSETAEAIYNQGLDVGDQIEIVGEIETQEWEDKNGGGKRSKDVITIRMFQIWKKRDRQNGGNGGGFGQQSVSNAASQQGFGGQQNRQQGADDPWGGASQGGFGGNGGGFGGGGFGGGSDEPPF
ncbi:ssDNA binding protein [Gordonia phage Bantam]|uniref:SsDNA binding protein n=1 Tax=Gordonia phage Bantam TaxID=1887641 RepID=A0A1B3AYF2_9CAUD|nr:ssDNA binding protein [Gordonia phage Bantam]AOE43773.1 ssDNA binding protein [Gordonia phage Bantam]